LVECTGFAKVWEMVVGGRSLGFSCSVAGHSPSRGVVGVLRESEEVMQRKIRLFARDLQDVS